MRNRQPKHYVNGLPEQSGEMVKAREVLQRAGIYRTLGNFGPLFPNKLDRCYKHIETITLEGYEFMIIESEVMSFSFSSMGVSQPYTQREAWFQPVKNC
jgi:hypothetical protein